MNLGRAFRCTSTLSGVFTFLQWSVHISSAECSHFLIVDGHYHILPALVQWCPHHSTLNPGPVEGAAQYINEQS